MAADDLIQRYLSHLRSRSASPRTIGDRLRILTVLDRDLPYGLDCATEEELEAWLWRDGLSIGSRETYYGAMAGFFRWAFEKEVLDFDPTDKIARPQVPERLPRPLSDDELRRILAEAAEPYRTFMILAAYAGLRCVEISRLRTEDVTEETVTIRRGKGEKPRIVGTHPEVWKAIRALPPGPVTDLDEHRVSIRSALHFRRALKLPGVALHRGRHWFGTNVQRLNKDLLVTQKALGHRNPKTTAGYALVAAEDVSAAVNLLPTFAADDAEPTEAPPPPRSQPPDEESES